MLAGERVVGLDLGLGLGVDLLVALADHVGQVGIAHAAAGEGEGIVDEHGEPALGQLVGPAHAAVILLADASSSWDGASSLIWAILRAPKYLLPPWSCRPSTAGSRPVAPAGLKK